jgi:hypothetical protein
MSETEQQASQPKREFLKEMAPWAETLSKAVAGIVIALYACGFLIISIYHSKYGFVGTNPFRPRVLAAGAWFFLFTAIPVSIALRYRTEAWSRIGQNAYALWVGLAALSFPFGTMLFEFPSDQTYLPSGRWGWAVMVFGLAVVIAFQVLTAKKKGPQWLLIILSVSLTVYSASFAVRGLFNDHHFGLSGVTLWFFATTLLVKLEIEVRSGRKLAEDGEWSKPLVLLFGLLMGFSREIYPRMKASWGGGTPANVTVYFTKDSLLSPSKAVQSQLIEESDEGFYIVGPKDSKAIFIPRSSVALIYFSDKAADSAVLQGVKQAP